MTIEDRERQIDNLILRANNLSNGFGDPEILNLDIERALKELTRYKKSLKSEEYLARADEMIKRLKLVRPGVVNRANQKKENRRLHVKRKEKRLSAMRETRPDTVPIELTRPIPKILGIRRFFRKHERRPAQVTNN